MRLTFYFSSFAQVAANMYLEDVRMSSGARLYSLDNLADLLYGKMVTAALLSQLMYGEMWHAPVLGRNDWG